MTEKLIVGDLIDRILGRTIVSVGKSVVVAWIVILVAVYARWSVFELHMGEVTIVLFGILICGAVRIIYALNEYLSISESLDGGYVETGNSESYGYDDTTMVYVVYNDIGLVTHYLLVPVDGDEEEVRCEKSVI